MNTNHIHLPLVWQIHDNLNSEDRLSVSCFHLFFCKTVFEWQALLFQLNCTWSSKVVLSEQIWSDLEMASQGRAGPLTSVWYSESAAHGQPCPTAYLFITILYHALVSEDSSTSWAHTEINFMQVHTIGICCFSMLHYILVILIFLCVLIWGSEIKNSILP